VLELRGVTAGYGATTVLRSVHLVVPDASVVALLGANGAGKTTLLRVASGLLGQQSGQLLLDGEDVTGLAPHQLAARGICHVPEGRGIFGSMTVRENLLLQARAGDERAALERAVDAFPKLGQRMAQQTRTMSGGEQQMVALARAYVQTPRVILLDEVSMGLAPRVVEEIFQFLARLASHGVSLLIVEQYVKRALAASDFVYLLNRGEIAFAGEAGEVDSEGVFSAYLGADVGHATAS
jgi:branched-chain amino acid transport system ATP-binding protein